MFFTVTLYLALVIFGIGTIYRISTWYRRQIGLASVSNRFGSSIKGILGVIFSVKILFLLKALFVSPWMK